MSPLVTAGDVFSLAVVALVAVVPLAMVLLAAIFRGYTIDVHMTRDVRRGFRRHRRADDDDNGGPEA